MTEYNSDPDNFALHSEREEFDVQALDDLIRKHAADAFPKNVGVVAAEIIRHGYAENLQPYKVHLRLSALHARVRELAAATSEAPQPQSESEPLTPVPSGQSERADNPEIAGAAA